MAKKNININKMNIDSEDYEYEKNWRRKKSLNKSRLKKKLLLRKQSAKSVSARLKKNATVR